MQLQPVERRVVLVEYRPVVINTQILPLPVMFKKKSKLLLFLPLSLLLPWELFHRS